MKIYPGAERDTDHNPIVATMERRIKRPRKRNRKKKNQQKA